MIKRILGSFFTLFFIVTLSAQQKQTPEEYIKKYYKVAIKQMKQYKIPASITLAQGILESGSGNSALAKNAKNHFGIKCHKDWKGKGYYMDDDAKDECFRVYKNPIESYSDHSLFLTKRGRYQFLFTDYRTTDYKKWAHGLKKAGYATNPKYPQLLIKLIERYHLYKYDRKDFVPEERVEEDLIVLEEIEDEDFELEQTDAYIKALMGKTVYYSDKEKGIFIFNRIKTIKGKGRTPLEIAIEFNINYELLLKYNDIKAGDYFAEDQNVFLQPKRFQGSQKKYLVKPGDSMWEISQMFGIKLSTLYKKNMLSANQQLKPGETVFLRKKRKNNPQTISYQEVLNLKKQIAKQKPKKIIQQTVVKPQETTININITDHTKTKEVVVEKQEAILMHDKVKQQRELRQEEVYAKEKYVDKNEKIIQIINEIPVEKKETISNTSYSTYRVQQGETLYFLSRKFNVSIDNLKKWNNLLDNGIDIGQELIISPKE